MTSVQDFFKSEDIGIAILFSAQTETAEQSFASRLLTLVRSKLNDLFKFLPLGGDDGGGD